MKLLGHCGWEMCRKGKWCAARLVLTASLWERYLCESAWAAIAKCHTLDGWSNRGLSSHSSGGLASILRRPAESDAGEDPSWGAGCCHLAVCSRHLFVWQRRRDSVHSVASPYKGTNPIVRGPPSQPHLNWVTSQRPYLQIPYTITSGWKASTCEFWGDVIQSIALLNVSINLGWVMPWQQILPACQWLKATKVCFLHLLHVQHRSSRGLCFSWPFHGHHGSGGWGEGVANHLPFHWLKEITKLFLSSKQVGGNKVTFPSAWRVSERIYCLLKKKVDGEVQSYHVSRKRIRAFVNSPNDPCGLIPIIQVDKLR